MTSLKIWNHTRQRKMFTVSKNVHVVPVYAGRKKELKKFRKFGKKLLKDRQSDFERMGDRMKDIAREEERRTKELLREHREFFEKDREVPTIPGDAAIDFFDRQK
jgi:hypothetical protein